MPETIVVSEPDLRLTRLIHYMQTLGQTNMAEQDIANHAYLFALELVLDEYEQELRVNQEISHKHILIARWKAADLLKQAEEKSNKSGYRARSHHD